MIRSITSLKAGLLFRKANSDSIEMCLMLNLSEHVSTTIETQETANMIAAICPFQECDCDSEENFKLTPSENDTGWFFECRMCRGANCTGFLRND
jgi:hypothetical protein